MIYRWPQGRILRIIAVIAVILMALDLGLGAWGQYVAWESTPEPDASNLVYMALLGGIGAVIFVVGIAMILFVEKTAQFLIEVEQEMTKVTWPSRTDIIRSTIMIAILAVVLAAIIALLDIINYKLIYQNFIGRD